MLLTLRLLIPLGTFFFLLFSSQTFHKGSGLFLAGVALAYSKTLPMIVIAFQKINEWVGIPSTIIRIDGYISIVLKTSYLGQLQGYLSVLDGFERKPHENPAIGIILCKDMNKSFVDYVIQDYTKPMGVATYKTSKDMPEELKKALPPIEALKKLLDAEDMGEE